METNMAAGVNDLAPPLIDILIDLINMQIILIDLIVMQIRLIYTSCQTA